MNFEAYLTKQGIDGGLIYLGKQTTTVRMAAEPGEPLHRLEVRGLRYTDQHTHKLRLTRKVKVT